MYCRITSHDGSYFLIPTQFLSRSLYGYIFIILSISRKPLCPKFSMVMSSSSNISIHSSRWCLCTSISNSLYTSKQDKFILTVTILQLAYLIRVKYFTLRSTCNLRESITDTPLYNIKWGRRVMINIIIRLLCKSNQLISPFLLGLGPLLSGFISSIAVNPVPSI
jgi:hypothetical protein